MNIENSIAVLIDAMRMAGVTVRIIPKPPGSAAHVWIQDGNLVLAYGYYWDVPTTVRDAYALWLKDCEVGKP